MRETPIHLMVRHNPNGLYATSPQLPGFAYGRRTLPELRADLQDALSFHFDRPGPFRVAEHHEWHYEVAGNEFVIRVAQDESAHLREQVADRLGVVIKDPAQVDSLAHRPANTVGEVVYVCALPTDNVGWFMAQLDERGDAFHAAITIADSMLLTLPFTHGGGHLTLPDRYTLGSRSYSTATPLSEIIRMIQVVTPVPWCDRATA